MQSTNDWKKTHKPVTLWYTSFEHRPFKEPRSLPTQVRKCSMNGVEGQTYHQIDRKRLDRQGYTRQFTRQKPGELTEYGISEPSETFKPGRSGQLIN